MANQSTGWFGCFSGLGSLPCIRGLQGGMRFLQWTDSPMVSVYKHIYHLELTLWQNEIKKVCLLSAENVIILSFRIDRCKMKQRIHNISFCVDLDNAK